MDSSRRTKRFGAPRFAADARATVERIRAKNRGGASRDGKEKIAAEEQPAVRVTVPAVVADRNARLYDLEFAAESKSGARKVKLVIPEGFNHALAHRKAKLPSSCVFSQAELPQGEIRFVVTPRNCFGRCGAPLTTEWRKLS